MAIINILILSVRLQTSESDAYRRHILGTVFRRQRSPRWKGKQCECIARDAGGQIFNLLMFNPLSYLNFHPLEVVSRYRDPQLQVKITHICLIWDQIFANLGCSNAHFIPNNSDLNGWKNRLKTTMVIKQSYPITHMAPALSWLFCHVPHTGTISNKYLLLVTCYLLLLGLLQSPTGLVYQICKRCSLSVI